MELRLDESWKIASEFIPYGFGRSARSEIDWIINNFNVSYIIDNSSKYINRDYRGIKIIPQCKANIGEKTKIIILAMGKAAKSIEDSLIKIGLKKYINFCGITEFAIEYSWRFYNKVCINRVTLMVTQRCTFKCKNCNNFMPYYKNPTDILISSLKTDIDMMFKNVDHIIAFVILGGEPFLYSNLEELLIYIGEKYYSQGKITSIQVTTNGSICPNEKIISLLKKYNVIVQVSDYTNVIRYKQNIDKVCSDLVERGVEIHRLKQMEWLDFGYPNGNYDIGPDKKAILGHMKKCNNQCQIIYDEKYWYCSIALNAYLSGLFNYGENEYLNLDIADAEEIIDFHIGANRIEGLSFCRYCRGFGDDNDQIVPAGVQVNS